MTVRGGKALERSFQNLDSVSIGTDLLRNNAAAAFLSGRRRDSHGTRLAGCMRPPQGIPREIVRIRLFFAGMATGVYPYRHI